MAVTRLLLLDYPIDLGSGNTPEYFCKPEQLLLRFTEWFSLVSVKAGPGSVIEAVYMVRSTDESTETGF